MRSEKPIQFSSRWYLCTIKTHTIMCSAVQFSSVQFGSRWYGCARKMLSSVQDGIYAFVKSQNVQFSSILDGIYAIQKKLSYVQDRIYAFGKVHNVHFSSRWCLCAPKINKFKTVSIQSEKPIMFSSRWYRSARKSP